MFARLQREAGDIIEQVIGLAYFMRGSVSYEELMRRTYAERQRIADFIDKRLESQKNSMHPVY